MHNFLRFLALSFLVNIAFAQSDPDYEWIQYVHDNKLMARATTLEEKCPIISIDGKSEIMHFRAKQEDIELKETVRVCEYNVTSAKQVSIRNKALTLPPKQVNRFIVLGDTGCEASFFESKHVNQDCNDKNSWPLEKIANKIALAKPDFVIHMGDSGYRNKHKNPKDAIKNQKMQWFFFKNDFLKPTANLLSAVPMLFIRGNHETCKLMGKAWFLFLDPQKFDKECVEQSPTYNLKMNDLNFVVFDSSGTKSGNNYPSAQLDKYKAQFAEIAEGLKHKSWLLIHHPIIGLNKLSEDEFFNTKITTPVVNKAFSESLTKKIPLAISGHFHVMANIVRKSDHFEQFIVGNGGTLIHRAKHDTYSISNEDKDVGIVKVKYGYLQFDRIGENLWKATSFDLDGKELFSTEVSSK